jgi:hypothetical protein
MSNPHLFRRFYLLRRGIPPTIVNPEISAALAPFSPADFSDP